MKINYYISFIIPIIFSINCYSMVDNRDTLVKFNNGNNRCGLASLNQCFSVLNPGNNQFFKQFQQNYYNISHDNNRKNTVFDSKYIIEPILNRAKLLSNLNDVDKKNKAFFSTDCTKFLNGSEGSDVAERYQRLYNLLSITEYNVGNMNGFGELKKYQITNNNIDLCNLVQEGLKIGIPVTDSTLNLIVNNSDITNIEFYKAIQTNNILNINNDKFKLSSLILLVVEPNGNFKPNSHFVSAKQLSNGKWRFIDSSYPQQDLIYDNFDVLMSTHVIPKQPNTNKQKRLMPKLMFYTKIIQNINNIPTNNNKITFNNKQIDNSKSKINNQKQELNNLIKNITNQIKENKQIIIQIAMNNKCCTDGDETLSVNNFLQNIRIDNKEVFEGIIKCDFQQKNDEIYNYFTMYNYGCLYDQALDIISNILNLQQTLENLQMDLSKLSI